MTLNDLIQKICTSTSNDWYSIDTNGPLFKHRIKENGQSYNIDQHNEYASFRLDLSITLAWDLVENENFVEPYANNNPDSHSKSMWLDVFYNGALVFRQMYILVDGGRAYLPTPTYNNGVYEVFKQQADFVYIINDIIGITREDYEGYLNRNNIIITNSPWNY